MGKTLFKFARQGNIAELPRLTPVQDTCYSLVMQTTVSYTSSTKD